MANRFMASIQAAYNTFMNKDPALDNPSDIGPGYSVRPDRMRFTGTNEKSIVGGLYLRGAIDVAALPIIHCKVNEDKQFVSEIQSPLNECLTLAANIDQTGRAFIQDVAMNMYNDGVVGIIPIDTSANPEDTASYDIYSLRTARILDWYPQHVKVSVYNDRTGLREEVIVSKTRIAIIENPFYAVMNEPNSILKRLVGKLNLLDAIDTQSGSGRIDMIVKLPYSVKSADRIKQAEERVANLEKQLANKKFGIAYIDAVEEVIPLNRPIVNTLMEQITYLTSMLYSQLGITQTVFDGTADEATMLLYHSRMVEPTMSAIVNGMKKTFLTKTARTQGQSIMAFRDPFKLVPIKELADLADKLTRSEAITSNEIRSSIGLKRSNEPDANKLRNTNLNKPSGDTPAVKPDPTIISDPKEKV